MQVSVEIDGERQSIQSNPGESAISHNHKIDAVFEKMVELDLDTFESVDIIVKTKGKEEPNEEGAI